MSVSTLTSLCGKLYGSSDAKSKCKMRSKLAASSPLLGIYP